MKRKILFLYGNRPAPLAIHMLQFLNANNGYEAELLYYDRKNSPVSLPRSGLLNEVQCSSVAWPVGKNFIVKGINRCLVLGLLVKKIRAIKPDVIHAFNLDMLFAARLAACLLGNTKVAYSLQDTTEWMLHPIAKAVQRWAYRGADLIFVTSQDFETRFLRQFKLIPNEKKVVFVPNVPLAAHFANFTPETHGSALVIGYVGLLRGKKGITCLIEAAELAGKNGADIHVLFAGKGSEREFVEKLAQQYSFVEYLGTYRHDKDIIDIYKKVDILYGVYDRTYDKRIHMACRFCEAVNCRLPIIVAKGSHMADIVETHGIGVSVEFGDVEGLAGELVELYQSRQKINAIAANCEKIRPEYVFEAYQGKILNVYNGLWGKTS